MTRIHHRTYQRRRAQYDRIRHALDGQDAMRANASLYLRRPKGLTTDEWLQYLKGAHFFPVADTTLRTMLGLAFRKDPKFKVPPRLEPMLQNASFDGRSMEVLSTDILREILSVGRCAAVLDFPVTGTTPTSTPHLSYFNAESILDWSMGLVNGVRRLTYLRLHEDNEDLEDTGYEQHLVMTLEPALTIRRYHVAIGRDGDAQESQVDEEIIPTVRGGPLFYIPAVIFGPYNLEPDTEKPPMLDLVDVNVAHWENSANLEHALWLSAMPTPVITGSLNEDQRPQAIGPASLWMLPEGTTAFFLSAPSDAHESLRRAMQDKESRMNSLGATMILSGVRRSEAAETASLRMANDTATLQSSINTMEAGVRTLLTWAADWVQPGEVIVEFNKDLVSTTITPQLVTALLAAVNAGAMSRESFIEKLRKGEVIDRPVEEEMALIEEEGGEMGVVQQLFQNATR
ncbi:DUF4055 domain-containing protein [Roseinatronobacter sp. S2]|uniref:DUF4055 domain-containing protein n=1 Tax=Roseinatronobacter sp. S2 TaxID=3035471 RepID=UPI00241038A5|nr:DUF4055 domain-containing protein [Roseinatronobacter sp. S2]WFE74254.1 DUF4055 domain-containing protein [Roseinatronobacter sp. S2]